MRRRPGVDVPERQRVVRALHDRRRDLARDDLAEEAVSHRSPVVCAGRRRRPPRRSRRSRTAACAGPAPPDGNPRRDSAPAPPSVSPPSGPDHDGERRRRRARPAAAPPPASASQRWPGQSAARRDSSSDSGSSTPRGPRRAALLDRLERLPPQPLEVLRPDSAGDARRPLRLERNDRGHAELRRLLHQPGEAVAVTRAHRERQLRRPSAPLRCVDLDRPRLARPHQPPPVPTSPRRPAPPPRRPSSARRTRRWCASPSSSCPAAPPPRCPARPGRGSSPPRGHTPPAGVRPLVQHREARRRPAPGGTAAASARLHAGEDRDAAGAKRRRDRGQQGGVDGAEDVREHQIGRAEQRRQVAGVAVEKLDASRPRRCAPRCAAATTFASASFSIPIARAAPSFTAAMARIPLPLPRSSTRSPGRSCRSSSASAARVEPCSPLPNAVSGSSTTAVPSGSAASGSQEGTTVSRPKLRGPEPVAPADRPVHRLERAAARSPPAIALACADARRSARRRPPRRARR